MFFESEFLQIINFNEILLFDYESNSIIATFKNGSKIEITDLGFPSFGDNQGNECEFTDDWKLEFFKHFVSSLVFFSKEKIDGVLDFEILDKRSWEKFLDFYELYKKKDKNESEQEEINSVHSCPICVKSKEINENDLFNLCDNHYIDAIKEKEKEKDDIMPIVDWKIAAFRMAESIVDLDNYNSPDYFFDFSPQEVLNYTMPILIKLYKEKNNEKTTS